MAEWMRLQAGMWGPGKSSEGNESVLGIKKNRQSFDYYRVAENWLFLRFVCTKLGKLAGAWIWPQTIIKCGDNEWGYNSKPLHECTVHLNGCSALGCVPSYHGNLNGCTRVGASYDKG